jgi:hypothetical protein
MDDLEAAQLEAERIAREAEEARRRALLAKISELESERDRYQSIYDRLYRLRRISDINQSDGDQQVENATKTENNIEYSYSKDNIAVPMQPKYMSKLACLGFAINIINTEGNHFTCNGMDAERIAAELYAHALGYYSSSVLENMGLKSQWISDIKQCGSVADIGLGDGLGPIYQLIWHTP